MSAVYSREFFNVSECMLVFFLLSDLVSKQPREAGSRSKSCLNKQLALLKEQFVRFSGLCLGKSTVGLFVVLSDTENLITSSGPERDLQTGLN